MNECFQIHPFYYNSSERTQGTELNLSLAINFWHPWTDLNPPVHWEIWTSSVYEAGGQASHKDMQSEEAIRKKVHQMKHISTFCLRSTKTDGEYGANTVYTCMSMEKWFLLKLFQAWGREDKEEWWQWWILIWYSWCIVRIFVNPTMYPHPALQ
jgi:hypothetical protein